MGRPDFTDAEEKLISLIKATDRSAVEALLQWSVVLILSPGLFVYGVMQQVVECEILGFAVAYGCLCRFVYYQVKPSWRLKPIIDKYERACEGSADIEGEPPN